MMRESGQKEKVNDDRMFGFEIGKYWNVNSEKLCYEKIEINLLNTVFFDISGNEGKLE